MNDLEDLLRAALPTGPTASERAYLDAWLAHAHAAADCPADPFTLALRGGMLADRFAWVFIGGYQAALRATFPDVELRGWCALAVSEDRGAVDPLPGVVWRAAADGFRLQGYKTWIAACDHVQQLVVKARGAGPARAGFFLVDRDTAGLTLSTNPAPSMLPDLSQGRARFDGVSLAAARRLDPRRVNGFGQREALYIYVAFLGMVHRQAVAAGPAAVLGGFARRSHAALTQARRIDAEDPDAVAFRQLDETVQSLRRALRVEVFAADRGWQRDSRLIAQYGGRYGGAIESGRT